MIHQHFKVICRLLIVAALTVVEWGPVGGQTGRPYRVSGHRPVLPVVPDLEPRPSHGTTSDQQFRTRRSGQEREPVAAFLDSLKGNDATMEVIVARTKLLTTKQPIARENGVAVVAVSDPSVLEFDVLPDSRMIRLIGRRVGTTDLMVVTSDGQTYSFAVQVVYDLELLRAHLKQAFPDAWIKLGQLREHVIVEGQARSDAQVHQILETIEVFLSSEQPLQSIGGGLGGAAGPSESGTDDQNVDPTGEAEVDETESEAPTAVAVSYEEGVRPAPQAVLVAPRIINLLEVPGVQQVMLKVQIAELNRTAIREIGTDLFGSPGNNALLSVGGALTQTDLDSSGSLTELLFDGAVGTLVGVFDSGNFVMVMRALRQNNLATVLAEPNLVTLDGHEARFQSGGEFPVPVAQQGGGAGNNTVQFKNFGIQLAFVPFILDGGVIRLHVEPEVSNVAEELGTTLIIGGDPIPGLRTRNARTTVELREGQTLAIAGLLDKEVDSTTARIPLIGDLPYIGTFFGSAQHEVIEQELLVAVTPYLVSPIEHGQRPPLPGTEILEPNDLEFYLLQRMEGRTGRPHRATTQWDNPFNHHTQIEAEQHFFIGPVGLSD